MRHIPTPKFDEWRAAEREAQELERGLHAAMIQFATRTLPGPLPEVVTAAREKRAHAHSLFHEAMAELEAIAASLHYARINAIAMGQQPPAASQSSYG